MTHGGEVSFDTAGLLSADAVLDHAEMATVVTDRFSNIVYWNAFAERLFARFPGDGPQRTQTWESDRSILSLGIAEKDHPLAIELARHVLRGGVWEGTFDIVRGDGALVYVRAQAVPLRDDNGDVTGIVIMAREAMKSNDREKDRFGLLERIGERLASSLYVDETLKRVAEMLVPQFADHCMIDLFDGPRLIRRISVHAGGWLPPPGTWAGIGEPIVYPKGHFARKAMDRQDTVLVEDIADHHFPSPTEASARTTEQVGIKSVIAAPLEVRGELLGLLHLARSGLTKRDWEHFDGFDRDLAGAIAGRAALAVDNAMLFEEERRTAESFQTHLLPRELPEFDGLEIAVRYYPAAPLTVQGQGIQTQVGGDWYDVIPLSAGRVGIVIGDVEGRGAKAAAIMGQLRAALRAFAQDDKSPADILAKLDEWVRIIATPETDAFGAEVSHPPIVTCQYFVYDAWSRQMSFANAGHAPPMVVANREAREMEIEHVGQPLGVRVMGMHADLVYREETRELLPGTALLFYTDGMVDRRPMRESQEKTYTDEQALEMLRVAVQNVAAAPVEQMADIATMAVPGEIDDDMALLVVRSSADDLDVEERTFPAEAIMVSEARRMAGEICARWGLPNERTELACLLVSEVVTNVVLHAAVTPPPRRQLVLDGASVYGESPLAYDYDYDDPWDEPGPDHGQKEFTLRLRRGAQAVWVEVFDRDMRLPRIRSAADTDEGGRGLYLVDQLAKRWGSRPTHEGKAVWFEIPITRV